MSLVRRALALAVAAGTVAVSLASCDGPGVVAPRGTVIRAGTTSAASSVVGTWRRTVYFLDDFGIAHSSETSWQFGADGAMVRVQVTRNLTFGLADAQVSAGRYRVEGTRLVIDVVTPAPSQLSFEVRRVGNQLEIAGEPYFLVGG